MAIEQEDASLVKSMLIPGETIAMTVRQRKFMPGGSVITPTSVVVTDRRLIIVNRAAMGIRKDFESIAYNRITSVRIEHGLVSSTVFVRVEGYDTDRGLLNGSGKQEGEIDTLKNKEARELADYINARIAEQETDEDRQGGSSSQAPSKFCEKCGARLDPGAKFCGSCGAKVL